MAKRDIIQIDEDKCDGCGQCVVDCEEAALQIVDGKARLVKEMYCDGLGACIGGCPTGALTIVQREAVPFDEKATEEHVKRAKEEKPMPCGCPGTLTQSFSTVSEGGSSTGGDNAPKLTNWPIQLMLVAENAPFLKDADLLIAADCTAFSTINVHSRFIQGKKLIIACPKLDNAQFYYKKLIEMFKASDIKSVSVLRMEVPCCGGLAHIVKEAIKESGKDIPFEETIIGIKGAVVSEGKTPLIPELKS
ncbi:MAG: 4Fe-4S binding protein [Nitrospirota bacterium]|nr:MAG: 4Fe-4S binding protein [Nitrospirota bacterium]